MRLVLHHETNNNKSVVQNYIGILSNSIYGILCVVSLAGAHTFGKGRCTSFGYCIYNQTNNDKTFALTRQRRCPRTNGTGDNNLENLDLRTPNHFDNNYFKNLLIERGLLNSNQVFFNGGSTDSLIKIYSQNNKAFDT